MLKMKGSNMHQETFQEKSYHDMLPSDLKSTAHVTFGYQDYLRIIQEHLQNILWT